MRVAIVVAIVLFAATPARAQVTIGSLPDPDGSRTCMGSCTLAPVGATAPQAGVITSWRVKTIGQPGPVRLQVIRANAEVGHSALVTPTHDTTSAFLTRIPIAQNDRIALMCCDQTPGGFVKMT